jgi:hypothetical protein
VASMTTDSCHMVRSLSMATWWHWCASRAIGTGSENPAGRAVPRPAGLRRSQRRRTTSPGRGTRGTRRRTRRRPPGQPPPTRRRQPTPATQAETAGAVGGRALRQSRTRCPRRERVRLGRGATPPRMGTYRLLRRFSRPSTRRRRWGCWRGCRLRHRS